MDGPTVTIEGHEYPIGTATIGQAAAIAPVAGLVMNPGGIGAEQVVHEADDLIRAVVAVTGCPRETVERQTLVEFVRIAEETAAGFINANGAYIQNEVGPALEDLMRRADEVMQAAAAQDGGGTPPAAE